MGFPGASNRAAFFSLKVSALSESRHILVGTYSLAQTHTQWAPAAIGLTANILQKDGCRSPVSRIDLAPLDPRGMHGPPAMKLM